SVDREITRTLPLYTPLPYTTLFRSEVAVLSEDEAKAKGLVHIIGDKVDQAYLEEIKAVTVDPALIAEMGDKLKLVYTPLHGTGKDRKSTRLNSSHVSISYAVFCLKN